MKSPLSLLFSHQVMSEALAAQRTAAPFFSVFHCLPEFAQPPVNCVPDELILLFFS